MTKIYDRPSDERVNWVSSTPFFLMHLAPLGALIVGADWKDFALCAALYFIRMFFITAGFHRYFAHRSYKLGRAAQFVMAFGATAAAQKGPLWWAGHHRHHHQFSDQPEDIHSPMRGFWWSHLGWFLCDKYKKAPVDRIKDFAGFPEIRWLEERHLVPPALLAAATFLFGGWSGLFVGFFLSTVLLYHGVFFVNSLTHVFGTRRYATSDTSRNSLLIALLTCGEGWHNNHHYYQSSVRQGFFWWELDLSYYALKIMSWAGVARELNLPGPRALKRNRIRDGHLDVGMFAAQWKKAYWTIEEAKRRSGNYCEARKKGLERALEEFSAAARRTAEDVARVSKGPVKAED